MKSLLIVLSFLLIAAHGNAQNYKEVKIYFDTPSDVLQMQNAGMQFDHFEFTKDNAITTFISDDDYSILQSTGFAYEILIDDWFSYYESLPKLSEQQKEQFIQYSKENYNVSGFGYGSMGGYFTLAEIYARLDSMFMMYPNIITEKFVIGYSIQNRPIYAVKISDNPNITENEPRAHFNALIHAREPQAMMTIMYYMYYLLENYGTDPEVIYLVNNREIYFIPCINPDGYEHNRSTNPNGGGMWRKNRRNNGGSFGVDLNRNFGYMWGYNNTGSSGSPSSETYRGTAPFSEPEAQAVRDFFNQMNFKTALNYHTYGRWLLYPWGYIGTPTPDNDIFVEYSNDMVAHNGYVNGQPPHILYEANGTTDDWMYGDQTSKPKVFAMTPEVGSSFWPSQSLIFPLAIENLKPNLYYTWVAGEFVSLINPSFSQQYFNPGDFIELSIPSLRNKGLSDAANVTLSLSADHPDIIINNGSITIGDIQARTSVNNNQKFTFTIGQSMPADVIVKMMVTVSTNGTPMYVDTLSFITGIPTIVFADTTNIISTLWTVTATPSNSPKWEETNLSFYSPPVSYTDSKNGNYINNATVTMRLTNPIDLSQYNNPMLVFWTRFNIEDNWDYGQVSVSTNNGATWIALPGLYTEPGTGSFQPGGEPVYDGVQSSWVREEINLAGYNSSNVRFRFQLRSDGSVVRDGWYVDDIAVIAYVPIPVELTSFSAAAINGKVHLEWSTASELNNHGFEIQRALNPDGQKKSWHTIGFVQGAGTTTEIKNYSFVDANPMDGISYYRLKQVDFDGTFRYYDEVKVEGAAAVNYELGQNYPNPFNPGTVINYSLAKPGNVEIKVFNILGAEISTLVNEYKEAGRHNVELNADELKLTSGVYLYSIKSGEFTQTRKMVVLK